jgi:ADP-heptose:LPS heptosyltransferase
VILALRALGLGDLLTAVPAMRALRRRPSAELALAIPAALTPLVARLELADRIVTVPSAVTEPPTTLPWSGSPPTLAVNLHGKGPQSTQALAALRPSQLWSYNIPGAPDWCDGEHEVRRWCRLVEAYGCEPDPDEIVVDSSARHDGPVLVHPGAAGLARRWPAQRYASVVGSLVAQGQQVLVTAGPAEVRLAERVTQLAGLPAGMVVAGLDIAGLAELVASARLVVCGDTGVAHLATAYRTPSVVLFGPESPYRWGPPARPYHRVIWHPSSGVYSGGPHPSLLRIQPDEVLAAAVELLARSGH